MVYVDGLADCLDGLPRRLPDRNPRTVHVGARRHRWAVPTSTPWRHEVHQVRQSGFSRPSADRPQQTCSKECRDKWTKRLRQREFRTYDLERDKAEREAQRGGKPSLFVASPLLLPGRVRNPGRDRKFHTPTGADLICRRLLKKATSRAAMAPAAKLGDSQMMFFMDFS